MAVTQSRKRRDVEATESLYKIWDDMTTGNEISGSLTTQGDDNVFHLEDSYSYSDPFGGATLSLREYGDSLPTDSLESVLGQSISSMASIIL